MRLALLLAALFVAGCASPTSESSEQAADGEPAASQAAADSDSDGETDADAADGAFAEDSPALLAALRQSLGDSTDVQYRAAGVDLDGDGRDEVVAHVIGRDVCGSGGCSTYVLATNGDSLRIVTVMSVSRTPIAVGMERANGWLDLLVSVSGGGIPAGTARLRYTGSAYPGNPTTQQMTDEQGTILIDPLMMDDALQLGG